MQRNLFHASKILNIYLEHCDTVHLLALVMVVLLLSIGYKVIIVRKNCSGFYSILLLSQCGMYK